jgi:hypothetical protein
LELGILDDNESIALPYFLVFLETDFLDEAWNTGVDGRDVLTHSGIIGPFDIAKMNKATDDITKTN